jgi:hypothetical protein
MKVKYRQVMYNGSIAMKYAHHAYKCTLIENNDVEHKMSEISMHENHRSGVKYYLGIDRDSM